MPIIGAKGSPSSGGFGQFAQSGSVNYIEDVFSTWLYTGNSSTQTITNGIDLAGKGGLVWVKYRSGSPSFTDHFLMDSVRGVDNELNTNNTSAQGSLLGAMSSFNSNGFTLGNGFRLNQDTIPYASWTFREQPKFMDIVTYTGNGSTQTINHNLGSTPGFIICKSTTSARNWLVYHRSIGATQFLQLDTTIAATTGSTPWNNTEPTSTTFTLGNSLAGNENGQTFVAYLFAHNAGGFGLTGTDNVISCGSFTTDGTGISSVNLGYEPQFVLYKTSTSIGDWVMADNIRQLIRPTSGTDESISKLAPNLSSAEVASLGIRPTSTGFDTDNSSFASKTFIYIAIRRGPMKVPTTGTSVYSPQTATGVQTTNFVVDAFIGVNNRASPGSFDPFEKSRLQGGVPYLTTSSTAAEASGSDVGFDSNTGVKLSWGAGGVNWYFQRAPGFFDVVCYTGTGTNGQAFSHNLGVAPELMIVKRRSSSNDWRVYQSGLGSPAYDYFLILNSSAAKYDTGTAVMWTANPTSSQFFVSNQSEVNASGSTYVNYLFSTCPGVSKVGTYTGNGSNQTINCGFTGGARFILIKRTDSTGDWYVWDSARGIVSGNDPHLSLNTTAAEVTTDDSVDTDSTGFVVNQLAATNVNVTSATYIFLAIA
jgi:hypothetical protein